MKIKHIILYATLGVSLRIWMAGPSDERAMSRNGEI